MRLFKKMFFLLSIIFLFFISSFDCKIAYANENLSEKVEINEEAQGQLDELYNYINDMKLDVEIMSELDPVSYIKSYIANGEGNLSIKGIFNAVVSFLFKELKIVLSLAFSIIAIGIISALIKNLQESFSSESISQIAFYACYSLLIVILAKTFLVSLDLAKDVIVNITNFMSKLLPILVIMLGVAGGFTQAATMDPIILGATILIPKLYMNIIIPLILMSFVIQFANNISTESKLSNLQGLLKKSIVWIQGMIMTVFIAVLTIRGATTSTIDAVTLKTTKFAVDTFIPIVGKALSDAILSVAGYSLIIKNAIGSIGLIVIILIILYPLIKIALSSFVFKIVAIFLEPITDKRITNSIASAGESLVFIMGSVIFISVMFFILIAIMVQAGKYVVGG